MIRGLAPALRFAKAWSRPPTGIRVSEVRISTGPDDLEVAGSLVAPSDTGSRGRPMPGWVVLHGITRKGRQHPELLRFVGAVTATGGRVLVPEITAWENLRFAPKEAQRILRAAVDHLSALPDTAPGGIMLVGFSFGAPQALIAASDPKVGPKLRGVVGWGGYADLERVFRFAFTGEHDWNGVQHRERPDPYVRWVIGANTLLLGPERSHHTAVVDAVHRLAAEAGDRQIDSSDPALDPLKVRLGDRMDPEDRALFDLFAPASGLEPDRDAALALVEELIPRIHRELPLLDPVRKVGAIEPPVRLLHGRADHLIPFTETLRLGTALGSVAPDLTTRITGLFRHAGGTTRVGPLSRTRESLRFLEALGEVFAVGR